MRGSNDKLVKVINIGLMMLSCVEFQGFCRNVWSQRIVAVGKIGSSMNHMFLVRLTWKYIDENEKVETVLTSFLIFPLEAVLFSQITQFYD
jgi:hypothetical protein